ncbi:MAG: hypothetical protein BGO73_08650 [Burkholderiales bacterium 66-26]|nr:MAG: hypothetical protein BGO73_08650 [Burkholderiales bacterium 66-26]
MIDIGFYSQNICARHLVCQRQAKKPSICTKITPSAIPHPAHSLSMPQNISQPDCITTPFSVDIELQFQLIGNESRQTLIYRMLGLIGIECLKFTH